MFYYTRNFYNNHKGTIWEKSFLKKKEISYKLEISLTQNIFLQ